MTEPPAPAVSVLMVAHNAWAWTEQAIAAVAEHTPVPFELILVDNASSDGTPANVRAQFPWVTLVENAVNTGFGPANNQAAAHASAPVLALLNTDALVGPGWLEPLLAALSIPDVGAVVPRLVHLDGRLQEAGALLWDDGTVHSYGDGEDRSDPAYGFRRTVDFGAAACMVLRADLFEQLGGFDARYAPAYYEDADLCLQLAARGFRTVYEPASSVVHVRYASSASDHARTLSERNRARFAERWGALLAARPQPSWPTHPRLALAARDAPSAGRVLVLAGEDTDQGAAVAGALTDVARGRLAITLLEPRAASAAGPQLLGVERVSVAPPELAAWLADRCWHYDLVYAAPGCAALASTQPQALVRELPAANAALLTDLARAGILLGAA